MSTKIYQGSISSEDETSKKKQNFASKCDEFINILLLGETGVGKSTFINSFANYLTNSNFKTAEKKDLIKLIPSKFKVQDKYGKYHVIQIGSEDNHSECLDVGMSATQEVISYVFPIRNGMVNVRLIDTPGIGDVRGIEQDNMNCENILSYVRQFQELHAICYLFKPTNSRKTVYFQYCMSQLLSRLHKSASKNIIFIFTNTRGTDYGPGDTLPNLEKIIDDIKSRPPHADIPLNKNIFCFDNEAFRYLAAIKQNIEFDNSIKQRNDESWKRSVGQCNSLIKYIIGDNKNRPLEPHFFQNTYAINEVKRLSAALSKILAETSQLINENLSALQRHQEDLDLATDAINELKKKLYMPIVDVKLLELPKPMMVCVSSNCVEIINVKNVNKYHFKQICEFPCSISTSSDEIIGCPELLNSASIDYITRACKICRCDFSAHMITRNLTTIVDSKTLDQNVKENIDCKEKLWQSTKELIKESNIQKDELEREYDRILKVCIRSASFLQHNVIIPYSDSYGEYIDYLIIRERSQGVLSNMTVINDLQKLLQEHEAVKQCFDGNSTLPENIKEESDTITPQKIQECIQELYNLKYNGAKIKEVYNYQKEFHNKEWKYTEYIHEVVLQLEEDVNKNVDNDFQTPQITRLFHSSRAQQSPRRGQLKTGQRGRRMEKTPCRVRSQSRNRVSRREESQSPCRERNQSPISRHTGNDKSHSQPKTRNWIRGRGRAQYHNVYRRRNQSYQDGENDHLQSQPNGSDQNKIGNQRQNRYRAGQQLKNRSDAKNQSHTRNSERNQSQSCDRESGQSQIQFSNWDLEEGKLHNPIRYRRRNDSDKQFGMRTSSRTKDSGSDRESDWAQSQLSVWDPEEERNPQRNGYTKRNQSEIQHRSRNQLQTRNSERNQSQSCDRESGQSQIQFSNWDLEEGKLHNPIRYRRRNDSDKQFGMRTSSRTKDSASDRESDWAQSQLSVWDPEEERNPQRKGYTKRNQSEILHRSRNQLQTRNSERNQSQSCDRESGQSQIQFSNWDLEEAKLHNPIRHRRRNNSDKQFGMRTSSRTKDSGSDRESDWAQSQLSVWDPEEERNPQRNGYTKRNQSEIQHRSRNQLQTQEDREDQIQSPKSKDNVSRNQFKRGYIKNRGNRQWHISYGVRHQSENR